jgi:hypothetical protein
MLHTSATQDWIYLFVPAVTPAICGVLVSTLDMARGVTDVNQAFVLRCLRTGCVIHYGLLCWWLIGE